MNDILKDKNWSKWKSFPDPRNQEYLFAPIGLGVYQLFNHFEKRYVLFGRGINVAHRMTSLLPKGLGQGGRNNSKKREYVWENMEHIQYRTIPFVSEQKMKDFEMRLKGLNIHIFNESRN